MTGIHPAHSANSTGADGAPVIRRLTSHSFWVHITDVDEASRTGTSSSATPAASSAAPISAATAPTRGRIPGAALSTAYVSTAQRTT